MLINAKFSDGCHRFPFIRKYLFIAKIGNDRISAIQNKTHESLKPGIPSKLKHRLIYELFVFVSSHILLTITSDAGIFLLGQLERILLHAFFDALHERLVLLEALGDVWGLGPLLDDLHTDLGGSAQ